MATKSFLKVIKRIDGIGIIEQFPPADNFTRVMSECLMYNFLKPDGSLLCKQWFRYASDFEHGLARVVNIMGYWNFLKTDGTYLSPVFYSYVYPFWNGFAVVQKENGQYNLIHKNGVVASKFWFDDILRLPGDFYFVKMNNLIHGMDSKFHLYHIIRNDNEHKFFLNTYHSQNLFFRADMYSLNKIKYVDHVGIYWIYSYNDEFYIYVLENYKKAKVNPNLFTESSDIEKNVFPEIRALGIKFGRSKFDII